MHHLLSTEKDLLDIINFVKNMTSDNELNQNRLLLLNSFFKQRNLSIDTFDL
jgi:hypothetical protein